MGTYVLGFEEIKPSDRLLVGGKGFNLGEMSEIKAIRVPEGFCVTTGAYKSTITLNGELQSLLHQLSSLKIEDREQILETSARIRQVIEKTYIIPEITDEIIHHLNHFDKN